MTRRPLAALTALLLVVSALAGCSKKHQPALTVRYAKTIGPGEGALNLVAFQAYAERGGNDPKVDWITPFEQRTQCKVNVKYVTTGTEMTALMSDPNRTYDGASVPPEVYGQLVAAHQAAPLNADLVDGYKDLQPRLRGLLRKSGKVYGVPFTWGADLVMYDPRTVEPAPTGWSALFDPAQYPRRAGRLVLRDSPLTIADAALYLKSRDHKLGIDDPYQLTTKQLTAVQSLLRKQHPAVQLYWHDQTDAINAFAAGSAVLGQVWPYHVDVLSRAGRSVQAVVPKEGMTGWQDSWVMGARARHPNCMYQWLTWMSLPDVQQQVAQWAGVAPANPGACAAGLTSQFCTAYHVTDRSFLDQVRFAELPARDCGGGGGTCTGYAEWTNAWRLATR